MSQVNNVNGLRKYRPSSWIDGDVNRYITEIELFLRQVYSNLTGENSTKVYTLATLPPAASFNPSAGRAVFVYVSNMSGGAEMAFSDGTSWRRFSDRTVAS